MRKWIILVVLMTLLGAACGDDAGAGDAVTTASTSSTVAGMQGADPAGDGGGELEPGTDDVGEEEPADTDPSIGEDTPLITPEDEKDVPETTVPGPEEPGTIDPGLQPYIDIAVADLAQRLGIDASNIAVVSAEVTVWNDASLGCPEPGMNYAQVLEDGSLIVLEAQGTAYRYHSGGFRQPFLCESS